MWSILSDSLFLVLPYLFSLPFFAICQLDSGKKWLYRPSKILKRLKYCVTAKFTEIYDFQSGNAGTFHILTSVWGLFIMNLLEIHVFPQIKTRYTDSLQHNMKKSWASLNFPFIVDIHEKKIIWSRENRDKKEFAKACFWCFSVYVLYKAIFVNTLGSSLYTCVTAVSVLDMFLQLFLRFFRRLIQSLKIVFLC